jgi:uncharacterized glyoxalase superfamily protein PhnB
VLGATPPIRRRTSNATNYLNGSPADSDALAALVAKGALNGVHFSTDDLDAAFDQVRTSGAEIVQEPTEQPWGTRDCAVRDRPAI